MAGNIEILNEADFLDKDKLLQDDVKAPAEDFSATQKAELAEQLPNTTEDFLVKGGANVEEQLPATDEAFSIVQKAEIADSALNPEDIQEVVSVQRTTNGKTITENEEVEREQVPEFSEEIEEREIKFNEKGIPPRIDPDKVKTEGAALWFFTSEVKRRFRLDRYDNMLEKLSDVEIEDALYDALEEINQHTPVTTFNFVQLMAQGQRYRRLLIIGAGKYCTQTLLSEWVSNGMDIAVEDISLANKQGDFQSLFDNLKTQFEEGLTALKAYDRLKTIRSTYPTGASRFTGGSSTITKRIDNIYSAGGRI